MSQNLNFISPINGLSYGICGLNLLLELDKLCDLSYFGIGQIQVNTSKIDGEIVQKCLDRAKFFDRNAKSVRLFHQFSMDLFPSDFRVGFPIFELNKFNELERHHFNSLDKILVCTNWAKEILIKEEISSCENISVVPLGVNRNVFQALEDVPKWDVTRYLYPGKWEFRKFHDGFVDYFNDAFEATDNVELYMLSSNHFLTENEQKEWVDLYKNSMLGDKIKFVPYQQSPHQLNAIYNSVDCVISLSRAEGWNLPLLEALSCGKEVIATNYSGHTAFLNKENAKLVDIDELELAYDGKWFMGDSEGEWAVLAESQKEQSIDYMREIHYRKQQGRGLFNNKGIETAKLFSWENSAKTLLKAIE